MKRIRNISKNRKNRKYTYRKVNYNKFQRSANESNIDILEISKICKDRVWFCADKIC